MKNYSYFIYLFLIFTACSTEDSTNKAKVNFTQNFESKLFIKSPTVYISKFSQQIGIESIKKVELSQNEATYHLNRFFKKVNNQDLSNFKTFKITINDGITELRFSESQNKVLINKDRNISFLFESTKKKQLTSKTYHDEITEYENTEIANLFILYDLVSNPNNEMTQISSSDDGSCNVVSMSAYSTKSLALYHQKKQVINFLASNPTCKKIGEIDSGCLWEDYYCVASQTYECTGSQCDWF
jgi:hypothetical protein